MEHEDNKCYFRQNIFCCLLFFQKNISRKSNNMMCFEHLTETLDDKNGRRKMFVIKIKNLAFVLFDIHVTMKIASLNINNVNFFKLSVSGEHLMFCKNCFIIVCGKECQYLSFIVF